MLKMDGFLAAQCNLLTQGFPECVAKQETFSNPPILARTQLLVLWHVLFVWYNDIDLYERSEPIYLCTL